MALPKVLPSWLQYVQPTDISVGYAQRFAGKEFIDYLGSMQVNQVPLQTKFYGYAYNQLLEGNQEWQNAVILAPYAVPKEWLFGSVAAWLENFVLVGRFKPPRILDSEKMHAQLIAPVIIELGRLNFDFIALRRECLPFLDLKYRQWRFGSVLVRARPGAQALFNLLSVGDLPILALPHSCKPVKYVLKRR